MTERTIRLVLLPGLDGTEVFFAPLLAVLPEWVKPVVITYPTSGANRYADLLDLVLATVEDEEDFYVLGWSFSGPLALMLAAQRRNKVRGVILCASFAALGLCFTSPDRETELFPGATWMR